MEVRRLAATGLVIDGVARAENDIAAISNCSRERLLDCLTLPTWIYPPARSAISIRMISPNAGDDDQRRAAQSLYLSVSRKVGEVILLASCRDGRQLPSDDSTD